VPLIAAVGFRDALGTAALVSLGTLIAVAAVLGRGPEARGLGPDGGPIPTSPRGSPPSARPGVRGALRTWRFWSVSIPFAVGLAAQVGVLTHIVALVTPGLGAGGAGPAVGAAAAAPPVRAPPPPAPGQH